MKGDIPAAAVRLAAKLPVRTHERKPPVRHKAQAPRDAFNRNWTAKK